MKKTLIIVLLIALVLGAFTACNGDVYEDLVEDNSITLVLSEYSAPGWFFKGLKTSQKIQIPAGCETWGDLVAENDDIYIEITDGNVIKKLDLIANSGEPVSSRRVYYYLQDNTGEYSGHVDPTARVMYPDVTYGTDIAFGKTYDLCIDVDL